MTNEFTACIWKEGNWYIAQCMEVDIASQGESSKEAVLNLKEALELYFEEPHPTLSPMIKKLKINIHAA